MIDAETHRRFTEKIDKAGDCWNWTAYKDRDGYGSFQYLGRPWGAHRISYELYRGKVPNGMMVCHECDNPSCVNPMHLFLGTGKDNMEDKIVKGRMRGNWTKGNSFGTKLTEIQVLQIREATGTQQEIAESFGISRSLVSLIKRKKIWSHI